MSYHSYIASNFPLEDVDNPHLKRMSANEAEKKGIVIPDLFLDPEDRDSPDAILFINDQKCLGDLSIRKIDKDLSELDFHTALAYCSTMEWSFTENRAEKLIEYIRAHMDKASSVEIWNIWLSTKRDQRVRRTRHINTDDLGPSDFRDMFMDRDSDEYCIAITKKIGK
ncbi:MAG: hypothetical protein LBT59_00800 [Clostridiales bacterium]|nr:hypothetical protein [Clostridiales bacterium]